MNIKMKKIGVLTFHNHENYGAALQNYALQRSILKMGFDCNTIDFTTDYSSESSYHKRIVTKIPSKKISLLNRLVNKHNSNSRSLHFKGFIRSHINVSDEFDKTSIYKVDMLYDCVITGSDQVWSRLIINDNAEIYSLSFLKKSSKASYAASCGSLEYLDDELMEGIKQLDYITVRENDLCNYLCSRNIVSSVVCDPTMLLSKKEWLAYLDVKKSNNKYIFVYYLDSGRELACNLAKNIAHEKNLHIRYAGRIDFQSLFLGKSTYSDGPIEFLSEILNAEYTVVSSFHGTVFSVLMEKQFFVIIHEKTGSRVYNLLKKLNLESRIIRSMEDFDLIKFEPIDYFSVNRKINLWRRESLEELKKICDL